MASEVLVLASVLCLRTLTTVTHFFLVYLIINLIVYRKFRMPRLEWFFRCLNLFITHPHLWTYIGSKSRSEFNLNCSFLFTSRYTTSLFTDPLFFLQSPLNASDKLNRGAFVQICWPLAQGGRPACSLTLAPTDVFGKNEKKNKTTSGYRPLHNQSPLYIKDLLKSAANYALCSSAQSFLFVPKVNRSTLGDRGFAHAAPVLWNSLPLTIRASSHRRTGRGGEGGCSPPKFWASQIFWGSERKFGQNQFFKAFPCF